MKLIVKNQVLVFKTNEVIRFESVQNHTVVCFLNGSKTDIEASIANITTQLDEQGFVKVHQNHLINVNYIAKVPLEATNFIELENGEQIPVTKSTRDIIFDILKNHI